MIAKILALDTSTLQTVIGLGTSFATAQATVLDESRAHGRFLVPRVGELLAGWSISLAQVGAFAVGVGPGSYTGLRVGITTAKVWAYVFMKPLIALDSLEAIAWNAPAEALSIFVASDAQRGDLHVAEFRRAAVGKPPQRVGDPLIRGREQLDQLIPQGSFVLGPAFSKDPTESGESALNRPRGEVLVELAKRALEEGRLADPWFLEPTYVRRSAAEDQWECRPGPLGSGARSA